MTNRLVVAWCGLLGLTVGSSMVEYVLDTDSPFMFAWVALCLLAFLVVVVIVQVRVTADWRKSRRELDAALRKFRGGG